MPATITGRLVDGKLAVKANEDFVVELLELQDTDAFHVLDLTEHTTNGSGNFSLSLYKGRYALRLDNDTINFRVPASTGTFTISDITEGE
jgi:hypothetical protein